MEGAGEGETWCCDLGKAPACLILSGMLKQILYLGLSPAHSKVMGFLIPSLASHWLWGRGVGPDSSINSCQQGRFSAQGQDFEVAGATPSNKASTA